MFESSTTQPPKIISLAATARAAEKTWLLQCLKALLRNLPRLFGQEGGLFSRNLLLLSPTILVFISTMAPPQIKTQS